MLGLNLLGQLGVLSVVQPFFAFIQQTATALPASPELIPLIDLWVTILCKRCQSLCQALDAGVDGGETVTVDGNPALTVSNAHGGCGNTR